MCHSDVSQVCPQGEFRRLNPGYKLRLLYGVSLNRLLDEKLQAQKENVSNINIKELHLPHCSKGHEAPPE